MSKPRLSKDVLMNYILPWRLEIIEYDIRVLLRQGLIYNKYSYSFKYLPENFNKIEIALAIQKQCAKDKYIKEWKDDITNIKFKYIQIYKKCMHFNFVIYPSYHKIYEDNRLRTIRTSEEITIKYNKNFKLFSRQKLFNEKKIILCNDGYYCEFSHDSNFVNLLVRNMDIFHINKEDRKVIREYKEKKFIMKFPVLNVIMILDILFYANIITE